MAKKSFLNNKQNKPLYLKKTEVKEGLQEIINVSTYKSNIDYNILNVDENEKKELIECEEIIIKKQEAISISLMELSTALYKAQQILSQKEAGDGTFTKWYEQLKLSKNFVYRALNKYKLYLISNIETVMDLTVKETTALTKALNDNVIQEAEVIEIINSDDIINKLKDIYSKDEEKTVVDISSFIQLSLKEQKEQLNQIKKDKKIIIDELNLKKKQLEELKNEINIKKEQINYMKEIESNMKEEYKKNIKNQ